MSVSPELFDQIRLAFSLDTFFHPKQTCVAWESYSTQSQVCINCEYLWPCASVTGCDETCVSVLVPGLACTFVQQVPMQSVSVSFKRACAWLSCNSPVGLGSRIDVYCGTASVHAVEPFEFSKNRNRSVLPFQPSVSLMCCKISVFSLPTQLPVGSNT